MLKRNLNRRKLSILNKKNFFYITLILLIIAINLIIYSQKNLFFKTFSNTVDQFSKNFDYQYTNFNVNDLVRVNNSFLENKLKKYYKNSIFLLPLDKISKDLKENNWIKNVKLSTNFRNTLFIEIEEYEPLGIYSFNKKKFYFDKFGKIIEEVDSKTNNDEKLIIFVGQSSNLKANIIIDIIESLEFNKTFKVKKIIYREKRRWDVFLDSNIKLMLSESNPKKSLQNYLKIKKNLSEADMNNIKWLDLRNINKTLITYY